jgi:hypothetical protein
MPLDFFLDPLRGRTRLWRVFWLYGIVVSACYIAIADALLPGPSIANRFVGLGALMVALYQSAALWRCAYNSPSPFVARIVRTAVAVGLIVLPLFIYSVIENGFSS